MADGITPFQTALNNRLNSGGSGSSTSGSSVYMGSQYQAGDARGTTPLLKDEKAFAYDGWAAITSDANSYSLLTGAYMVYNKSKKPPTLNQLQGFYYDAVGQASDFTQRAKGTVTSTTGGVTTTKATEYDQLIRPVTVTDVLNNMTGGWFDAAQANPGMQQHALNGAGGGGGAYNGPVSRTTFTNKFDANLIVDNALTQYLGRAATDSEKALFQQQLHAREAANPTVVTPHGKAASTQTGGTSSTQQALEFAQSRKDYGETTANTTLATWFGNAIASMKSDRIV